MKVAARAYLALHNQADGERDDRNFGHFSFSGNVFRQHFGVVMR